MGSSCRLQLALAACCVAVASAAFYVDSGSGSNMNDGKSPGTAFADIYMGIDRATHEQKFLNGTDPRVFLMPGTYQGAGNTNITHGAHSIWLLGSTGDPADVVIDGEGKNGGLNLASTGHYVVQGITIRNCRWLNGAALQLYNAENMTLSDLVLEDNKSEQLGGSIFFNAVDLAIFRNITFHSNEAGTAGGGLSGQNANLDVDGCRFTDNEAPTGGALFLQYVGGGSEVHSTSFRDNEANRGGAIYIELSTVALTDNEIRYNDAVEGGGLFLSQMASAASGNDVHYNDASGKGQNAYCASSTLVVGSSNSVEYTKDTWYCNSCGISGDINFCGIPFPPAPKPKGAAGALSPAAATVAAAACAASALVLAAL